MRFFITGIGGFAAGHLAALLLERGHEVSGLAHRPELSPALQALARRFEGFDPGSLSVGDIRDAAVVTGAVRRFRPDGVFHLAAQSSVGSGEGDASSTFSVNAIGTLQLLSAVRGVEAGCRVLVVSSGESYGRSASAGGVSETTRLRPVTVYGASKAASELLAQQAVDGYGADVVCARSFNHTGPGQSPRFVCADFARQITEAERGVRAVIKVGNLDAVRDFLDVRDVVRAYVTIWEKGECGAVYNVASGVGRRINDVLAELSRAATTPVVVEQESGRRRPVDIPVLVGLNQRLASIGWKPEWAWEQTIRDLLQDWRERTGRQVI